MTNIEEAIKSTITDTRESRSDFVAIMKLIRNSGEQDAFNNWLLEQIVKKGKNGWWKPMCLFRSYNLHREVPELEKSNKIRAEIRAVIDSSCPFKGGALNSKINKEIYEAWKLKNEKLIQEASRKNSNDNFESAPLNLFLASIELVQGKELISDFQQIETFENIIEQREIEHILKNDYRYLDKYELLQRIKGCENEKSEMIIIKGISYKRHNYLMAQIKRYRDFKCQFCSTSILKENGEFYIEACHIKAKAKGGKDSLENILVLCPNCHKLFDFGKREDENYTSDYYSVLLNGKKYQATLK